MGSDSKILDVCHLNKVYPKADEIFTMAVKSTYEIKDKCLVVLDTNTLLLPYETDTKSLKEIEKTYKKLIKEKRLYVPGQVAREFAKNRVNKLTDLNKELLDKKSRLGKSHLRIQKYPLFQAFPQYKEISELENKIDELIGQYSKNIDDLINYIRSWNWDDPVSSLYRNLFKSTVITDFPFDQAKIQEDLEHRYGNDIPPGYKDQAKEDKGIGDLLIWYTILDIAQKNKADVIFVSGDKKADWFHQSAGQPLYPRFELIDEFYRKTDGKSFQIISFSEFLKLYDVSEDVVKKVRAEEIEENQLIISEEFKSKKDASIYKKYNLKIELEELIRELHSFYLNQCDEEYFYVKQANKVDQNRAIDLTTFKLNLVIEFASKFHNKLLTLSENISLISSEGSISIRSYAYPKRLEDILKLINYLKTLRNKLVHQY